MKIGILTFQFAINYGAVLQCYGLQQYLTEQGHKVQVINFIPPNVKNSSFWKGKNYQFSPLTILKHIYKKLKYVRRKYLSSPITGFRLAYKELRYAGKQKREFTKFTKRYLNLSETYTLESLGKITNEYDAIIVGSDQIWNQSQHYHATYFLGPFKNYTGKRISYAPCCAVNQPNEKFISSLKANVLKFDHISVRNIETFQFVKDLTGIASPIVVDPSFLYNYKHLLTKSNHISNDYILTYIIGDEIEGGHEETVREIKKYNNDLPVVSIILTENKPKLFNWSDNTLWHASPQEWLNLFYNASFIYTDSFHGAVFAIKFKKPFLAYYQEKSRASRFLDLIERYELSDSIISSLNEAKNKNSFKNLPNYKKLDPIIEKNITLSRAFLEDALKLK